MTDLHERAPGAEPAVVVTVADRVALVELNRPERLNAANRALLVGVAEAFIRIRDDDEIVAAVLTGRGRAFCTGMDIVEWQERGEPGISAPDISPLVDPYFPYRSDELGKPIIAAVNGAALGAGFYLATNADLIVAARSSCFEITEVIHGALVGWEYGLLAGLPRAIATELALGGRLSAGRAYDVGMINAVVDDGTELDQAMDRARRFVQLPPLGFLENRRLLNRSWPRVPADVASDAAATFERLQASHDLGESLAAFLERRPPRYQGR